MSHSLYYSKRCECSQCSSEDSNEKDIKQLKMDNISLSKRVEKLEKLINDMILYQPDGNGYKETKENFKCISNNNKVSK